MQYAHRSIMTLLFASVVLAACSDSDYGSNPSPNDPGPQATIVSATGTLTAKIDEFRALLGEPNNGGTAGQQAAGRREIGWDGAAANPFNNKNDFPANFFNTTARNGAVFTTPGTGFRNDSLKFAEVNAAYANQFATFSPTKIFSPVGSNVMDVLFQVAGQPSAALVTGFGAVFSDVDAANASSIEFFDSSNEPRHCLRAGTLGCSWSIVRRGGVRTGHRGARSHHVRHRRAGRGGERCLCRRYARSRRR